MPSQHITRTQIDLGGRVAPLVARVNHRAKRLILRVDPVAGEIFVTAPSKGAIKEAIAFARERRAWIAGQMNESLRARPFEAGAVIPLRGRAHVIRHDRTARRPVEAAPAPEPAICVSGEPEHLNRRLTDWLKAEARRDLRLAVDRHAAALGKPRPPIRVRDARTRWGSCTARGDLSISRRLILAPAWILDYVAAHECAHLEHLDHSPAFWRLVRTLGVDARAAEDWFSEHGARLFAYGAPPGRKAGWS